MIVLLKAAAAVGVSALFTYSKLSKHGVQLDERHKKMLVALDAVFKPILIALDKLVGFYQVGKTIRVQTSQFVILFILLIILTLL